MSKFPASRVMDMGPSLERRDTSRSRVSSPSAANTDAESASAAAFLALGERCESKGALRRAGKVFLDQRQLDRPPVLVGGERLDATLQWNPIES